jgi:hypothetical protein
MLGRAKAFGAGQLRVAAAKLHYVANGDAQATVQHEADHKMFRDAFENLMEKQFSGWRNSEPIRDYLGCCLPANGNNLYTNGKLEYIKDVKIFGNIRKMTMLKTDGSAPCFPTNWIGRYLETPSAAPNQSKSGGIPKSGAE